MISFRFADLLLRNYSLCLFLVLEHLFSIFFFKNALLTSVFTSHFARTYICRMTIKPLVHDDKIKSKKKTIEVPNDLGFNKNYKCKAWPNSHICHKGPNSNWFTSLLLSQLSPKKKKKLKLITTLRLITGQIKSLTNF